jgi:hypothetical protein
MAYFAVPENGVIKNIIVCDDKATADAVTGQDCVQYTSDDPIQVGFVFDKKTKTWGFP